MLNLIRNNSPYTVIILFIATLILKLNVLAHPTTPVAMPDHFVYKWIIDVLNVLLGGSPFGYTLLTVVMIFGQAIYLNAIGSRYKLFSKSNYILAFTYLVLTSVYPPFNYFSEPVLLNWCLLGALDSMLNLHQTTHPRKQIFNAAFILCLAPIIQFPAVGFVVLLFAGLLLLRSFNFGEWIVGIIGYLTPVYFFVCFLFLFDALPLFKEWPHIGLSLTKNITNPVYLIGCLVGIFVLFSCGVFVLQSQMPKAVIYVRRSWWVFLVYLIVSVGITIVTDSFVTSAWLISIPPLAMVIANGLALEKRKGFSNFILYFSLLLVVFCQLAYK